MKLKLLLLFLTNFYFFYGHSQNFTCPPNIDFELGNYSNWTYYTGSCCPILLNNSSSTPTLNRHTLTNGNALDPYGNFPISAPNSGGYSLKLGNDNTGSEAEGAQYKINLPASANNVGIIYQYAVVFEDPNHSIPEQPQFSVKVYDSASGNIIPCTQYEYIASSNLPGFQNSSISSDVKFKPWTTASIDLTGLGGQTIILDFSTGDCDLGGHFGYGYIDVSCDLFEIKGVVCNNEPNVTFSAPPGYASYSWFMNNFTNSIGNTQTVTIPVPPANTTFQVILTPYVGFGCIDTLETIANINFSNLQLPILNDLNLCKNVNYSINAQVTGSASPFSYTWTPANHLSCNNCAIPTINAPLGTNINYVLEVKDAYGCIEKDTFNVSVKNRDTIINAKICQGDTFMNYNQVGTYYQNLISVNGCDSLVEINLTNHIDQSFEIRDTTVCQEIGVNVGTSNPAHIKYNWNTADSSAFIYINQSGLYILKVVDINGCSYIDSANIKVNPTPNVQISFNNLERCLNNEIKLTGTGAKSYKWYIDNPTQLVGVNSFINVKTTGEFTSILEGTSSFGCVGYDSIKFRLDDCCENPILPNAFTPNNDGKNDEFRIINPIIYKDFQFQIFNRYGQKVFQNDSYHLGWDGKFKGIPCEVGTYYYQLFIQCQGSNKELYFKGEANLVR